MKQVEVTVTLNVPDEATHYIGDLLDHPTWVKMKVINGREYWFGFDDDIAYEHVGDRWKLIRSGVKPHWAEEIG